VIGRTLNINGARYEIVGVVSDISSSGHLSSILTVVYGAYSATCGFRARVHARGAKMERCLKD